MPINAELSQEIQPSFPAVVAQNSAGEIVHDSTPGKFDQSVVTPGLVLLSLHYIAELSVG